MIAAAFLVLLRPYSIQCVLLLLLLLLGTIATILFFCCWHRKLRSGKHPIKSVLSGRSRSREAGFRTHHFRSEGYRHSPRHARRSARVRVAEESKPLVEIPESDQEASALRKRKVKKRVQPEFYHSVQVTPTRKPSSGSGNVSLRCSMSSSADISDDDDYSLKSGSVSPAPGDTLPWNLPRHERSKRKIQGGSVLDPAERAVLRIADERDRVQKKTFTKWINQHLLKVRKHVNDLYEDLRDGHNLISLLEVLSGETLPREKGRMRFHRLQNVQIALDYLKRRQVKLVNIRNDDITDGNPKLTLGLIWTIILHFQISDIHVTGESEDMTAKERLLLWSQQMTEGYAGVRCDNFTTSWRDGRLFNAIIHKYRPDLVDMSRVSTQSSRSNLEQAFSVAEQLGVARLLDPEDVDVQSPDEKSVITYVSTLYDVFPKVPEGMEGINANDVDIKWVEYQNMVNYLSQWIKHHVAIMSDRTFPSNPVELKALYTQYLQFKENEIPPKENEKTKIKHLYKMLEVWIEFGRIRLPQGYHPNDVEKEWGKLIIGMLEREKSLRPELERLEMLQQIANRVQRDCVAGEDKLALARSALQSDAKRLESGIQFQNEAEIAGYLLECENILRQQVVDIQILLDGKFYLADQLVQRVSKLRDDLLALRSECSSVYSKGHTLTTEQTKMMISGITQSLNSGICPNLNSGLTPALTPTLTSGGLVPSCSAFSAALTPNLPPSLTPVMTPGLQPCIGGGGGVDPGALQQLKLMQIRKPLVKSCLVDPNMTEEEVNMNFVQDLLNWVEEMQVQLDRGEWGSDLPSVESHLENHKTVHRAIEEFQMSLKEAKISEIQMTQPMKHSYSEKLGKLETQYGKLLNSSRNRQKHLESLHDFVSRATHELIWLNEKEEEEVAFEWSDRNTNISKKRDYHADLMRELEDKEAAIKSVQEKAEQLLGGNHPARLTIEAYRAAMQTQWSWILQLCGCVEQHLKENAVYFEFFTDAKESMDYLKSLQDTIQRKYGCDRTSSLHKLEDLVQDSMDEKEQLLQYRGTVAGLVGRAKSIVQLKPRNSDSPVRTSIPVKAICDYRQIEITIYKDDECVLANNSHRAKWKVISPAGNEAMVPSVCFTVPPPNKEATDMASRIEQLYQNVLALWHQSHVNMKSVVSWHYLMTDIQAIRKANVASIKTMLPGEHQQVLSNLQSHLEDFLRDSEESEVFSMADRTQLERDVEACKQYYEELLKSAEREEHEESVYNLFIAELRNFRMRLESHEEHLIRQIRTPLDRDDLQESVQRIAEQEKTKNDLDRLKADLETMKEKCETFVSQAAASLTVPTLSSELNVLIHSMSQVYSMSSIYLEKLKTVSLVVKHSQTAEALVKLYEAKLCEEDAVNADTKAIETVMSTLKQWRTEIDDKRGVFHDLEDELQKARAISDRMFKTHNERDFDLDWHKEKADQLGERWQNVHSQIENRLRDLEGIGKSLKYYRDTYNSLDEWNKEMQATQLKMQENQPEDSKSLAELLNQQKVLMSEIEQKQSKIEECQKYSEQYSAAVKDYELQLMTYRAMVDSQHKSPVKRRRMQSSSDAILQEFMDLRTSYTALVTLMTQYVKFASETLKRTEEEEKSIEEEKKEHGDKVTKLLNWMSSVQTNLSKEDKALTDGKPSTESSSKPQVSMEELATKKEQIAEALRTTQLILTKHSDKMTEEEKQVTKEQLKSLHQAYSELSKQCADQTPAAEQEFQTIEGILEVGSGTVYSVCRSIQSGLIDQSTGLSLLEAQLVTSGLILPEFRMCLDLDDAFKHNLVDESSYQQLQGLNEANKCFLNERYASEPLPVIAAVKEGAVSERLAIKVIEIQLATGGLRLTYTGDVLNLEKAFQCGLIPPALFIKILERQNTWKDLIDPNTAEKVSLVQLVQRSLVHEETGLRLLPVKKGQDGIISLKSGREISILRAVHEGLIDRETMFRLLGAQLFAGGIVDPSTGRKLTVEEALTEGLIDQDTASGILSHQAQNGGIVNPHNGERLTVDEAVQCNLMSSSSALLVLEKQKGFMGLIWPHSGEILTVTTSLQHEIITNQLAYKLLSNRQKIAAFYIPENSEVVGIDSATKEGLIDRYTADVLKTIEIPDAFPDIDELNHKFSMWLSMRELQIEGSHQSPENLEVDQTNICSPSRTEAKQLFISYLMMNSYMDPKSGKRLLIFDGQLNKMTKLFIENIVDQSPDREQNTSPVASFSDFSDIPLQDETIEDSDDTKLPRESCIIENTESKHFNRDNEKLAEERHRSDLQYFVSKEDDAHSQECEVCIADEDKLQSQVSFKIDATPSSSDKNSDELDSEVHVPLESCLMKHKHKIVDTVKVALELQTKIAGASKGSDFKLQEDDAASYPTQTTEKATTSIASPTEMFSGTNSSSFSTETVSRECNFQSSRAQNSLTNVQDAVPSVPRGELCKMLERTAEQSCSKKLWRDKGERDNAVYLLKAQVEEGGILDVTSGKRYSLNAALEKGLVDEEIVLEVLASQLPDQGISDRQVDTMFTLKEAVSKDKISPMAALLIMEKVNCLGGFYDSESGSCISISDALEQGLITEDLAQKVLHSNPVQGTIIDSAGDPVCSNPEAVPQRCSDNVGAESPEHQFHSADQTGDEHSNKKVITVTLDLTDEQLNEKWAQTDDGSSEEAQRLSENAKQLSRISDFSLPLDSCNTQSEDRQVVPSNTSGKATERGAIPKRVKFSVPDESCGREDFTDMDLSDESGGQGFTDVDLSNKDSLRHGSIKDESGVGRSIHEMDVSDEKSDFLHVSHREAAIERNEKVKQREKERPSEIRNSSPTCAPFVNISGKGQPEMAQLEPNKNVSPSQSDLRKPSTSHSGALSAKGKTEHFQKSDGVSRSVGDEAEQRVNILPSQVSVTNHHATGQKSSDHPTENIISESSLSEISLSEKMMCPQKVQTEREMGTAGCSLETVSSQHRQEVPSLIGSSKDDQSASRVNEKQFDKYIQSFSLPLPNLEEEAEDSSDSMESPTLIHNLPHSDTVPSLHKVDTSYTTDCRNERIKQNELPVKTVPSEFGAVSADAECDWKENRVSKCPGSAPGTRLATEHLPSSAPETTSDVETSRAISYRHGSGRHDKSPSESTRSGSGCLSDSATSDSTSSAIQHVSTPLVSDLYGTLRASLDKMVKIKEEGAHGELQKAETQVFIEDIMRTIQNIPEGPRSISEAITADHEEKDLPCGHIDSTSPDLLVDLFKQEALRSDVSKHLVDQEENLLGRRILEGKSAADIEQIQCQLLQIVEAVSSTKDPAVVKDVIQNLCGILGNDAPKDPHQRTKSTEKQGVVAAAEGGEAPTLHFSPFADSTSQPQAQDVHDFSNTEGHDDAKRKLEPQYTTQNYLECVGRLQDHSDAIEEIKNDLETQGLLSNDLEGLQSQLEETKSLEAQLAALAGTLTTDLDIAGQLLRSADGYVPTQIVRDLAAIFKDLPLTFTNVCKMSAEKGSAITQAIETEKVQLESSYQALLSSLQKLSGYIGDSAEMVSNLDIMNTDDLDTVKYRIQQNKDMEKNLSGTQQQLENTAFEVQYFISEHAQNLSPSHSRRLLMALSATQRAFKELTEKVSTQRHTLDLHLEIREEQRQQKSAAEKQKEYSEKLQELCDSLTQTENRLIGHQQLAISGDSVGDLQQYQKEHQALQKDVQANASALAEVVSSTKKFLEENRSKLKPEQIAAIESQLEDAKSKSKLLSQRAEDSRKDLEKVVTTAIKQETEKVAAVEQLEESKNKIEGLLDWISNIGKDKEKERNHKDPIARQNGNLPLENSSRNILGEEDDANGNTLQESVTTVDGKAKDTHELDLDEQYDRVKAHHQEVLSQQQELIMATQSAQALLDKQSDALSPGERDKLQRDIQELRGRYETELAQAELQTKHVESLQEELRKFKDDCGEFEAWLQQAEGEVGELEAPAGELEVLNEKLQRQRSFSEDVISHKGDLRFITVSGQRVLDAAKACSRAEPAGRDPQLDVDTTGVCAAVKERLDSAAGRYKAVHSQCNQLGSNLKEVVDKYKKYEDAAENLGKWLNSSEEEARRQQAEPISADPQTLQKQLEETKALQGQTSGRQAAVETLRKTADALIAAEGDLLTNQDEILETVDDIVERYDNLSKSVSERNEKLQVTLTRSLSVQDGLDEMMQWMEGVEKSLEQKDQVPLNSAAIGDMLSKEAALEQDMSSRQSSVSAMKAKVKKFMEKAEPSVASSLQAKMDTLSQRFSDACEKHKQKVGQLEELKDKVELFEKTAEKVQQFITKRSQALSETEGPGKNVNELSQLMQDTNTELAEHAKDVDMLHKLSKELSEISPEGSKAQIQGKMESLAGSFKAFTDTVKEKEEEVSSCQDQLAEFRVAAGALRKWVDESLEKVPAVPASCSEQSLAKALQRVNALMEEWTAKGSEVQDISTKGSALCSLISVLTSPAKTKTSRKSGSAVINGSGPGTHAYLTNKELMVVQQSTSYINEGYENLGERLKDRTGELNAVMLKVQEARDETDSMMKWLDDTKKTVKSWDAVSTETVSMKTQMEQQRAFEEDLNQKQKKLQQLREKLLDLIEKHPDSPEAAKWKQMLEQIDEAWKAVCDSGEERRRRLEESSHHLAQFQTAEAQLCQWLSEKELMMGVLGPLSVDPNMLKAQKQQVQILLNEFDSRKPQYEQMNEAGRAILSAPSEKDPSCGGVREQLASVTQKWQGLTGQLGQRSERIDQALGKTMQFQGLLKSLTDSAANLEARLQGQQALSTQPDAVKKQLEAANDISAQLREERKRLREAESLCSELSALVGEEYLRADLARQLESVTKPFKLLEEKAGKRIEQLNSAFASSQQFHQMSKDFQGWLEGKRQEGSRPQPISTRTEALQRSIEEQEAFQRALSEQETPYHTIVREGEALLQTTEDAEKVALQGQLSSLRSNWEEVKKGASDRMEQLQGGLQRAQRYEEQAKRLGDWVEECQAKVCGVKLSVDPAQVESSFSQVKAIQKDADKHRGQVDLLNSAADSVLEVATVEREAIKEETAAISQKVDSVMEQLQQKKESLETIMQRMKDFNENLKDVKGQIDGARKQLETHESLGVQAYSSKNLTNMKAQQRSLAGLQAQVDQVKSLAQGLVVDVPEAEGVTDLLLQTDSLEKDYGSVHSEMEEKCSALEGKLQGIGLFQDSIREMFARFADLDDELDSMAPVARDQDTLRSQQTDIRSFVGKLQELMDNTADASNRCKKMLETEASPDLSGLRRDLEALTKQCGKLMDRAKARDDQVESTLTRVDELYKNLHEFTDKLRGAEKREESQGPVGMETEVINQQLEAFKVFQKEEIEPLQAKLQDLNWLGQGLIQSAAKNTSTQDLEHDLEDVNARWNTLNKKIAERSAQLHEALLHCGRFQDALESLLSWLRDTEELVANQKPPSAEFKVVKAQIQEQKLLQRLLDDRKPTVELIKKEGAKMSELAEPADREKIVKEIDGLGQRWDALLKRAETRHKQLESTLGVAQQFHETLEPLSEWLTATEKRLANSEPIGTQTKKLEEQISQHKSLEEEVRAHSKNLHQAISLGQVLRSISSMDDKELVQTKLDAAQTNYMELHERSRRRAEMLQQALSNAQLFGEDEVALMNWLSEVHDRLSEVSVQDYKVDVLEKQNAEQLALHEDIEQRKQNIDQAISNGMELLKQTTGDEVVVIQGKLDGIKTRYAEINSMSSKVSKTLEQALSLAARLQHTHEGLSCWLEGVEAELEAFQAQAPVGEQLIQAQDRQKELLQEVREHKAQLDSLNEVSSSLLELVPWRAREGLDKLVSEDNERYKLASDTIAQHVDEIDAAILKSQQFEQAADSELSWLGEAERKLASLEEIRLEPEQTVAQLQAQKAFSMDILRHKDAVDDIVKTGEAIMNSKDEEEKQALQEKIRILLEKYGTVSQLNSERCLQLERAHSLASQFWETYEELWPWLQETRAGFSQLPQPAIEYETLKQQQEELRQMRELIAEHKPHIDKMNKTGPQLLELSPVEGKSILEKYTATDQLYTQLKADVKQRASALDEAISKSTQFHDKIDPMLESLERIVERLRQPPSISVEVEKIREQISENKAVSMDLEKLQPAYETLKQRGQEMIARSEGADKDISAKAVQDKLDQMVFIWNDIQALLEEREAKLLDVMDLAEKFWCDHCALIVTIKDTHDLLKELEEPGVDPSVVKQQQESVENFKEEIDGLQEELDVVRNLGAELLAACGEPDKPVIKKSIDEVNLAWENLNKTWKERVDRLEEAMQAAVQFQDSLQGMFDWVDIVENKLDSMSPVGTDLETVKQQIEELKEFKGEVYQLQIEMERLNHQGGLLLKKVVKEADRSAIQEPLAELKMLWDNLDEKTINRQHKLEGALLALGQFQHALDELLAWLTHTEELLNEQRKAGGDPKAIEIELAKHHVLQNDVLAHKSTVEAVNKAGNDLMESSAGEEASSLQSKLESLNQRWENILEKTKLRRQHLDSALLQAQGFHGEIEDMQQWLKDTERQLLASKAVGGLPETAREQLNAHLELCSMFQVKEELYQSLMQRGQQLLAITPDGQDTNTEQDLKNLQEKWDSVQAKVAERKGKLEEALTLATEFHNSLQDFINWLTQAEQTLTMASPASLILETIMFQIDEHKVFVTEVNSHREQIIDLDKTGTHLKYFSQKQDVVLIKNLLISVQSRWEKVVQRSVERGRLLDDARKRAKQFHETWHKLTEWLEESEKALDSELEIANDPDKIKMQLAQHKEFQKALGSKHSVYDTTIRTGRALKDKSTLEDDHQRLDDMLSELRDKWDTVCGKSVERQNKLEEALLFSGQFTDALQALIDWLYKVEPQLAEDQPVHGDIDLVLNLIDSHKVFQKELGKRTGSVQALKRSARELIENSHDDSSWVKVQMQELSTRWETVCARSVSKQTRLEQALSQAEEFHSTVHILLEWLAEAEQSLRFHGALPDDEEALRALIEQHKEFMKKLEEKRAALTKATSMGEAILTICHPDSITTIKHWNTIIKARFEEVQAWARQHLQRLGGALSELLATLELLENLLGWLQWAEATLNEKDKEALPQEIEEVKALIAEHQTFMEEMTRKQPDVDKITKTHKRKATAEPPIQSHIPVLEKGRAGRKRSPMQGMYPAAAQPQIETKNPRVNLLVSKWQQVWLLALDRRRKLNDALDRLEELKEFANFDFDVWRKRYMRWMNHKKSRVMDFFRRIDKDQDGKVTRQEFIDGILSSKFPTSRLEMSAVADIFDRDGDGYIDYYEFVAALHPNKDAYKPLTDADKIEDEVTRQVAKCKCPKRFQVEQIGANKYRFYLGNQFGLVHCLHDPLIADETIANRDSQNLNSQLHVAVLESCILFGDSQQLRLVRILRSTVMVRVGGGWMALDEFLVKNDPCRVHHHGSKMLRSESNSSITQSPIGWQLSHFLSLLHPGAKGRTNMELREKFILPEGTTQVMASFRYRGRKSRPSSRAASPNRSNSSQSCPGQPIPAATSTPKTSQHLTRNYDKPWLTNSKPTTPLKSSDSFESQGSSTESTPIQGSKLRLPGYLSGKGFQSGEEGALISAAVTKARAQVLDSRKTPSRPGSKAGSRGSSRRGSDASDFDISDIQSVCSDVSETVADSGGGRPRAASRPHSGKPSKIPTPQRRSPAASKIPKASKR
ncbi:LOW QUALITY PROTEIN: dystonin [Megalops cyprinoides]|uniref:LOW QUALITY PROTEIN: dystonin n=1 Tax=Megalops cyprinoides TaxID=118141 RepID=UPI001864A058|nr:LOW QUALITY PROTEIN: dystonin [Megalops cyprinoides]